MPSSVGSSLSSYLNESADSVASFVSGAGGTRRKGNLPKGLAGIVVTVFALAIVFVVARLRSLDKRIVANQKKTEAQTEAVAGEISEAMENILRARFENERSEMAEMMGEIERQQRVISQTRAYIDENLRMSPPQSDLCADTPSQNRETNVISAVADLDPPSLAELSPERSPSPRVSDHEGMQREGEGGGVQREGEDGGMDP